MSLNRQPSAANRPHVVRNLARRLTVPLILLLTALLRFYQLSDQSLWADEGNSVALARRGFLEIAQRTAFDIHPPFYYWLLNLWISIFGDSEIGLRSLSVVLGVVLVYLIGVLGSRLFSPRVGLIAAFIAAFSPLQIYYAQEARMYMLLALLSTLTVLVALILLNNYLAGTKRNWFVGIVYVLIVTAGLYTHYAYPLILLVVNVVALSQFWRTRRIHRSPFIIHHSSLINWLILQLIPLLLYLPWLPTAWRQITTWPSEKQTSSLLTILAEISTTLLFGLSWPFDLEGGAVVGLGLVLLTTLWLGLRGRYEWRVANSGSIRCSSIHRFVLLWLWFLLPVILTVIIFSPTFLKFLLVATPPLALMFALMIERLVAPVSQPTGLDSDNDASLLTSHASPDLPSYVGYLLGGALLAMLTSASVMSLYHYYTNPSYARDNYRGIVDFIKAVGGAEDAVILNAEGQQDVFNYYYENDSASSAPVYSLPRQRPLDEAATLNELQQITARANKIYAVYWATQQADPNGLIEGWLNSHLFKASDVWFGNVRLVSYASPRVSANLVPTPVDDQLGQHIRLTGYALSSSRVVPGDILQVVLVWETDTALVEDFTVFAQVLDQANHLVGQRDAQPLMMTPDWPVSEPVVDKHGIFIEPGTPPGQHRLIVGLYDRVTGQRLPVKPKSKAKEDQEGRDFIDLAEVEIVRPAKPLPLEAFNIQVPLNTAMLDVILLGYDLYKVGHRSTPDTPLQPGDPLHLVAYWTPHWPVRRLEDQLFIQVITPNGQPSSLSVTRQPAGTDYSIKEWQPGEIIRAQYDFFLTDLEPGSYRLALTLGVSQTSSQPIVAVTEPFQVE